MHTMTQESGPSFCLCNSVSIIPAQVWPCIFFTLYSVKKEETTISVGMLVFPIAFCGALHCAGSMMDLRNCSNGSWQWWIVGKRRTSGLIRRGCCYSGMVLHHPCQSTDNASARFWRKLPFSTDVILRTWLSVVVIKDNSTFHSETKISWINLHLATSVDRSSPTKSNYGIPPFPTLQQTIVYCCSTLLNSCSCSSYRQLHVKR